MMRKVPVLSSRLTIYKRFFFIFSIFIKKQLAQTNEISNRKNGTKLATFIDTMKWEVGVILVYISSLDVRKLFYFPFR